jgi:2,4-didehydro-3-deoxy-L-rhamnonate hydrolase
MRLCRYDDNRLGLVEGNEVKDVTEALKVLPVARWPLPQGDLLIANLDKVMAEVKKLAPNAKRTPLNTVKLKSPVANPSKIIGAPVNYRAHKEESIKDKGISFGQDVKEIDYYGLFLKASSGLVGASEGCAVRFHPDRRNDHEIELAVIIGKKAMNVPVERALDYVAGYAIGLDMTVRGQEERSLRKSIDSYSILGPWLTTADEVKDPENVDFSITVNGEPRQKSNTNNLIWGVKRLISYASTFYALLPGDIIMTGTPEGVGPVKPGDVMHAEIAGVGVMDVPVRAA